MTPQNARRRAGFTLVELLTVVGIIALLIGILIPSLSKARGQAKKVKVQAQISAVGKGLEMFRNDFGDYPDSTYGQDIIDWTGSPTPLTNKAWLSGAHWLVRALAGHDFQGVDSKAVMLTHKTTDTLIPLDNFKDPNSAGVAGVNSQRKGTYLETETYAADTDIKFDQGTGPGTGRPVMIDAFNYPLLYYRANPRARLPFTDGTSTPQNDGRPDLPGIYNQMDNALITGTTSGTGCPGILATTGWDFARTGMMHGLKFFATTMPPTLANIHDPPPPSATPPYKGEGFAKYLHSEVTHSTGNVIKPVSPETFVIISPGPDGLYGTDDDVSSFKGM